MSWHRAAIALAVAASVVASGLALIQPALLNQLIGSIEDGQDTRPLLVGLIVMLVANVLTASVQQYLVDSTAEKIVWSIRSRVVEYALRMPLETLRRISASQVISRVGPDAATLRTALTGGIFDSLGNALLMIGALVAMSLVDIQLLLLTLVVVIVSFSIVMGAFRITRASSRKNQEAIADVTTSLDKALSGIRTIRIYNATKQTRATLQLLLEGSKHAGIRLARVKALVSPANGLAVQGSLLVVLGVGGSRVAEGSMTIGELVTFVAYLFLAVMPMSQLLSAVSDVSVASGALDRIRAIFDESEDRSRPADEGPCTIRGSRRQFSEEDNTASGRPAPTVVVEDVSYQHGQSGFGVKDATFVLEGGSIVGLVGPSGSGKSTVLDLLSGLIAADGGCIRADHLALDHLAVDAWRSHVAYVEQAHGIISGTVRENLKIGRPGATDEEVGEALSSVNLARLAANGPHGLELVIDEDGAGLSGGERQRLAIARAIVSQRPIVLLDEPSANLDADNIEALIGILQSLKGTRTVLISTHSSEVAAICDRVLVMDEGFVHSRDALVNG
ncbi:ABC transporter ATP-binding protein [Arthrobacter sp. UYCu712]|uniref:ABC transporter ATP-binding protein n=1 Tax=Arthrobacter sp. UYCu712 TaxID=3156340 RepID=UPI003398D99F